MKKFASIDAAIDDIRKGKMVIVVDDESRENEGDLIMAAEFVTAETVNFMITKARGLVCVPMEGVYLVWPDWMALMPACLMRSGVSKSGSPAEREMTSTPSCFSCFAFAVISRVADGVTCLIRLDRFMVVRQGTAPVGYLLFFLFKILVVPFQKTTQ